VKTSSVPVSQRGQDSPEFTVAQVGPLIDFDIAFDIDAANVMVVFVRASRQVAAALQAEVRDDE